MSQALFSERYGFTPPKPLQVNGLDKATRNALWNFTFDLFFDDEAKSTVFTCETWTKFLHYPKDQFSFTNRTYLVKGIIFEEPFEKVFNFLEFQKKVIAHNAFVKPFLFDSLEVDYYAPLNEIFETHNVGYRFVNGWITPITNELEMETIEEAYISADVNVKKHLDKALQHFSNREAPDYRNSIKEALSAVGSVVRDITGEKDLRKGLQKFSGVHPLFMTAMQKLYDYSNDSKTGIRHELLKDDYIPTQAEAQYFLVTSSAFINYLTALKATT